MLQREKKNNKKTANKKGKIVDANKGLVVTMFYGTNVRKRLSVYEGLFKDVKMKKMGNNI